MATAEDDCVEAFCRLPELVRANEDPSFFQNSCTCLETTGSSEIIAKSSLSSTSTMKPSRHTGSSRKKTQSRLDVDNLGTDGRGRTKALVNLP